MEDLIEKLMNDPKMLAGAVVLVVLMIFSAFKAELLEYENS